jgi:hypothetical protein
MESVIIVKVSSELGNIEQKHNQYQSKVRIVLEGMVFSDKKNGLSEQLEAYTTKLMPEKKITYRILSNTKEITDYKLKTG